MLGGAGEERSGEVLGGRGGFGCGLVRLCCGVLTGQGRWVIMGAFTPHSQAMSEEQLRAFMEAVKADAGLQQKLNAAADADAVALIAKEMGFVISAEELQRAQAGSEVSEEDLEGVVGGRGQKAPGKQNGVGGQVPWWSP